MEEKPQVDYMTIQSRFLTMLISKKIHKILKKKYGVNVILKIDKIKWVLTDDGLTFDLNVEGCMDREEVEKLLK